VLIAAYPPQQKYDNINNICFLKLDSGMSFKRSSHTPSRRY